MKSQKKWVGQMEIVDKYHLCTRRWRRRQVGDLREELCMENIAIESEARDPNGGNM